MMADVSSRYLPELTWPEVEELVKRCQTVVIPLGAIEQHARHLPLATDYLAVLEVAKEAARRVNIAVAPSIMAGVSPHHMGFPGTISLSEETFAAVVFETAASLARHGFRRIILLNGHGGNDLALVNAAARINRETEARAIYFPNKRQFYQLFLEEVAEHFDSHAGVEETSRALHAFPHLVKMDRAEVPVLKLSEAQRQRIRNSKQGDYRDQLAVSLLMDSIRDFREFTSTGALTFLDVRTEASAEYGARNFEKFVSELCRLVEAWEAVEGEG